ncbi:hypothetical protein PR048_029768, partial [Dryococelus australis]
MKTEKVEVKYTEIGLVTVMKDSVAKYTRHVALDSVKKEMKENHFLIHCDFPENYNCKSATEIQSSHFVGFKPQVNLHTLVVYRVCPHVLLDGKLLKRTADRLVATGTDIPNFNRLTEELENHSTGTEILVLHPTIIHIVQAKLPNIIPSFKGTMQTHQVTWSKQKPYVLQVRRLSCLTCFPDDNCHHYGLRIISLEKQSQPSTSGRQAIGKLRYADLYSSGSDDYAEMGIDYTINQSVVPK